MCEEEGSLAALGKIPSIAYDVITVNYGASPLTVLASVQSIEEEQGTVYFKNVIASSTRGSHTPGDNVFNALSTSTPLESYAGDTVISSLGNTVAGTQVYNGNLTNTPVRPQKVRIEIPALGLTAVDVNGDGLLLGYNIQGTINYQTGAYSISLVNDPAGVHPISATTSVNFEAATDIPRINSKFTSKTMQARLFALKDTVGLAQTYAMRKRFGLIAQDEMTRDLVAAINSELMILAIRLLDKAAMGNTTFSKTAPAAVSAFEHRQSFNFEVANAEAVLLSNAGRGSIKVMVAGLNGASIISTLPGFKKIADGNDIGPHIFGELNGIIIIRVHNTQVLNPDTILCVHRGDSPFDAALVYSPYMPLVTTDSLPTGTNPLVEQKAAAIWAALDVVVGNFVTRITLTA